MGLKATSTAGVVTLIEAGDDLSLLIGVALRDFVVNGPVEFETSRRRARLRLDDSAGCSAGDALGVSVSTDGCFAVGSGAGRARAGAQAGQLVEAWFAGAFGSGTGETAVDLSSQAGADAALTYSRTGGDAYLQTDAENVTKIVAGSGSLFENRADGNGGGVWTWPAFTGEATNQKKIGGAGWTNTSATVTADAIASPASGETANKVDDATAGVTASVHQAITPSLVLYQLSMWLKDVAGSVPTAPGMFLFHSDAKYGLSNGSGLAWRRRSINSAPFAPSFTPLYPAGATPGGEADIISKDGYNLPTYVLDAAQTGAVYAWGLMISPVGDLPLIIGNSGVTLVSLTSPTAVFAGGDLDLELVWQQPHNNTVYGSNMGTSAYVFYASTPDGELSLRYSSTSYRWTLRVRGVDVLVTDGGREIGLGPQWRDMKVRATYKPSLGTCSLEIWHNGAMHWDARLTGSTTGGALAAPTSFYLGSDGSGNGFSARWRRVARGVDWSPELMVIGDSIPAWTNTAALAYWPIAGSHVYTVDEARTRAGVVSIATPGDRVDQQETKYSANTHKTTPGYFVIDCGRNDIFQGATSSTVLARLQSLVNTIRAAKPTGKVVVVKQTPCKTYLDGLGAGYYTTWQNVNTGISTLTSVDAVVDANTELTNGSGDPKDKYNSSDGVHLSQLGKEYVVSLVRTALNGLGF